MPEYLAPGVYLEEFEIGAKPIEGVSTSTVGFLGQTERGPTEVQFVTSFAQYQRIFGGYIENSYLTYAVDGFFRNGGQRCFIGRVIKEGTVPNDPSKAELTLDPIEFVAIGEGNWGNGIGILIENASLDDSTDPNVPNKNDLFKLTIGYWKGESKLYGSPPIHSIDLIEMADYYEFFDNLSTDSTSSEYYVTKVNAISDLVNISAATSGRPDNTGDLFIPLTSGIDGSSLTRDSFLGDESAMPGERTGLTAFKDVDEISIVYVADMHCLNNTDSKALTNDVISHCENLKDRFAILDTPPNNKDLVSLRPPKDSKYAAFYYPWIEIYDPLKKSNKQIPPGGYIAGIYARSDQERGVHKAPANEIISGVSKIEFKLNKADQALLNPRGVNCIRSFVERGIRVWGARTMSSDSLWKYINIRRLFIYVEKSIDKGTQWVVFEPNDEKLWARVKQTITAFLTRVWRDGALMGTKAEEAFFVKCDRSTMTQDDIDNGRLICVIGIAPVKPAEFVIFRIAQWTGGSSVTE